ncbi:Hsp70 family protein [Spirosoma panaciterrae]|uniref:Hsp70 family protein n=1 Tax=Spirosoma panaciterrae TaxID=496058 RepID=UPI00037A1F6A|nr:Hsp70 family protein [Spirosoma panaciterrae]
MNIAIDLGSHTSSAAYLAAGGLPTLISDPLTKDSRVGIPSIVLPVPNGALVGQSVWHMVDSRPIAQPILHYAPEWLGTVQADLPVHWLPETLVGLLVKKLKMDAETCTASAITGISLVVPGYITQVQQQALVQAVRLVDIPVHQVLSESDALIEYYRPKGDRPIALITWSSNRLTVSLLQKHDAGFKRLATQTISGIGGDHWSQALSERIVSRSKSMLSLGGSIPLPSPVVESIQIELSTELVAYRTLVLQTELVEVVVTRRELEQLIRLDLPRATQTVLTCLNAAGMAPDAVGEVLIAGGSTLVPLVRQWIGRLFSPDCLCYDHERLHAALYGATLATHQPLLDTPASSLIGRTTHHIGVLALNPDTREITVDTVIRQYVPLPARGRRMYYTTVPNQPFLTIDVVQYQGTNSQQYDLLGRLSIGPLPTGSVHYAVEVEFSCSEDGLLAIRTTDPETGLELAQQFQTETATAFPFARQRKLVRETVVNGIG